MNDEFTDAWFKIYYYGALPNQFEEFKTLPKDFDIRRLNAMYRGMVAAADMQVGRLMGFLKNAGKLDNNGEELRLKTASGGEIISEFDFDNGRGWPLSAAGCGHSLVPTVLTNQSSGLLGWPGNWRPSAYIGGSPGTADPQPVGDVLLNEIVAHTDVDSAHRTQGRYHL